MSTYEFKNNEVIYNTVVGHPKVSFKIFRDKIFYDNLKLTTKVSDGFAHIFDTNLNSTYRFIYKSSDGNNFSSVDYGAYLDSYDNGAEIKIDYPRSSSIDVYYLKPLTNDADNYKLSALTKTLNFYNVVTPSYNASNYQITNITLVDIPSVIFGSYIEKGTVSLKFYHTGTLLGELQDTRKNGELVQVFPTNTSNGYGRTAGVVLYNEGFVLLSGSWDINNSFLDNYSGDPGGSGSPDKPKWIYWGKSLKISNIQNSSFEVNFNATTKINTITMFATAPKSELNFSNNPTFLDKNTTSSYVMSSSNTYKEYAYREIKNTSYNEFIDTKNASLEPATTESFKRQVFINKIHIYDQDKRLIAIAKTATPVKKTEDRAITFKLKLDT